MSSVNPVARSQGTSAFDMVVVGGIAIFTGTGAPTNGTTGTGAKFAPPGSLYIRSSGANSKLFINTNTTASPTWTVVGSQT
jgi:hypothetical protein